MIPGCMHRERKQEDDVQLTRLKAQDCGCVQNHSPFTTSCIYRLPFLSEMRRDTEFYGNHSLASGILKRHIQWMVYMECICCEAWALVSLRSVFMQSSSQLWSSLCLCCKWDGVPHLTSLYRNYNISSKISDIVKLLISWICRGFFILFYVYSAKSPQHFLKALYIVR